MAERMKNPAMIIPEAMEAIQAFQKATYKGGVSPRTNAVQLGRIGVVCVGSESGSSGKTSGRRGWWVERGPWYAARLGNRRARAGRGRGR